MIKPQLRLCTPACGYKFHALAVYPFTPHLQHIQSEAHLESSRTSEVELYCRNSQRIKAVGYFRRRAPSWMFDRILNATLLFTPKIRNIPWNVLRRSPEFLMTLSGIFGDIPHNVWRYSPECLTTFLRMFDDIPGNNWRDSLECFVTFPGIFTIIARNVWGHSQECLATFPRMFEDIPGNV